MAFIGSVCTSPFNSPVYPHANFPLSTFLKTYCFNISQNEFYPSLYLLWSEQAAGNLHSLLIIHKVVSYALVYLISL